MSQQPFEHIACNPAVDQPIIAGARRRFHTKTARSPATARRFKTANIIPVTLGNIVGGLFFVGIIYWVAFRKEIAALK